MRSVAQNTGGGIVFDGSLGLDGADVARVLVIAVRPGKGTVDESARAAVPGKTTELVGCLFERAAGGQAAADLS